MGYYMFRIVTKGYNPEEGGLQGIDLLADSRLQQKGSFR